MGTGFAQRSLSGGIGIGMSSPFCILIVAGGTGARMKSDIPKQFMEIKGIPIIIRSIQAFLNVDPHFNIVISLHPQYFEWLQAALVKFNINTKQITVTAGGTTRAESVVNGITSIPETFTHVAIHDAARPLVSKATIVRCLEASLLKGNAVPCMDIIDSLRKISNNFNHSVNRNEYKQVQTPQCFKRSEILTAYRETTLTHFTDDATVIESCGHQINLVEGNIENIKITSPIDLKIASLLCPI